jgi:hypothetical protein
LLAHQLAVEAVTEGGQQGGVEVQHRPGGFPFGGAEQGVVALHPRVAEEVLRLRQRLEPHPLPPAGHGASASTTTNSQLR